ncbi:MAG TPA: C39 family peptidase [Anaerolineae bacterium]|nr:C39 family peptidase [Anaerolineae bacterium]
MNQSASRRQSPPFLIWLLLGTIAMLLLVSGFLGLRSWLQSEQVQTLQGRVEALERAQQEIMSEYVALQSSAGVLEERLSALEATSQAHPSTEPQTTDLQTSLMELQVQVSRHETLLDVLEVRTELLGSTAGATSESWPPEVRLSVARQRQSHNLSCESSAASMAAEYHGIALSEAEVLAAVPLDENPHLGFRGNVDGPTGGIEDYGVYAGPILDVLNKRGLRARLVDDGLVGIKRAIARGNPVLAWVTYDCQAVTPVTRMIGDQEVTLVPYQHVVVVTGYNGEGVWANDPWDGQEDFYSTADFERAMSYFGDMAIEVAVQ